MKCISAAAQGRPVKKGGASIMHWPNHLKSLSIQWVFKIAHPRLASWQKLMEVWIPNIKTKLFSKLGAMAKKNILRAIPAGATYIRQAIKQFWSLGLRQNIFDDNGDLLKEARDPDFLSSIPIFDNFLFKIRTNRGWGDTLSKLGFLDLGDLSDSSASFVGILHTQY